MLNKIYKEIDDFTNNIKEVNECDKLLNYINNDIYSSIKLLMSVSKSFSLYGRMIVFFIISLTGLVLLSSISSNSVNVGLLLIDLFLFVVILIYIIYFKNYLLSSIENIKNFINSSKN